MKLRYLLPAFLLSLGTFVFAQNDMQHMSTPQPAPSEAQKSFTELKTLAGSWHGNVTMNPPMQGMGETTMEVSIHVTSRGNALVHEMKEAGKSDDPTKNDHPVTMFYLDSDKLTLVHYCDAGNRPRMVAPSSSR